jgi:dTDP-4-amino-4,6-dideoxygalactose transaminase
MKNKTDFLVFGAPQINDEEISEVVDSMRRGWLGTGPKVARFESDFKNYIGASHAAAVNSCTAALHLSLIAACIGEGDEVITTPLTFCATINAIIHAGGTPVLADVDPLTMNIDPEKVKSKINKNTKAILPVHFAGRPCAMNELTELAKENNLIIIEDCAHAIEANYKGQKVGTFGAFSCFSFYVTKNLVTGEGGMVLTKNKEDADRIKILALHGMSKDAWKRFSDDGYKHYQVTECGFKYNMMDIQAAMGIHQLKRIEQNWQKRKKIWMQYNEEFSSLPVTLPAPVEHNTRHSYHLYTILIDEKIAGINRDEFLNSMNDNNIGVGVHYLSIPEHPFYNREFGWDPNHYPNAMRIGRQTVSLPLSAALSEKEVRKVIPTVKKILNK